MLISSIFTIANARKYVLSLMGGVIWYSSFLSVRIDMYREKKFKVEGLKNKPAPVEASSAFMKWMLLLIGIRGKGYSLKSFPPS